jgi:hypothetical protein
MLPAMAPMMISSSAIDTATQFCITEATSARPIHTAEASRIFSTPNPSSWRAQSGAKA